MIMTKLILLIILHLHAYVVLVLGANDCSVPAAKYLKKSGVKLKLWSDSPDANGYGSTGSFQSWFSYQAFWTRHSNGHGGYWTYHYNNGTDCLPEVCTISVTDTFNTDCNALDCGGLVKMSNQNGARDGYQIEFLSTASIIYSVAVSISCTSQNYS